MTTQEATIRGDQVELASRYLHFFHQAIQLKTLIEEKQINESAITSWGFVLHPRATELLQRDGLTDKDWRDYQHYRHPQALQELTFLIPGLGSETNLRIEGVVERFIPLLHPFYSKPFRPKLEWFRQALTRFFMAIACGELTEADLKAPA